MFYNIKIGSKVLPFPKFAIPLQTQTRKELNQILMVPFFLKFCLVIKSFVVTLHHFRPLNQTDGNNKPNKEEIRWH